MAVIRQCNTEIDTATGIPYYTTMGAISAVDLGTLQSLVGRINDRNRWNIVDRGGELAKAQFYAHANESDPLINGTTDDG